MPSALPSLQTIQTERERRRREAALGLEHEMAEMARRNPCLWPTRYADDTFDCAFRFLIECWWTDDEERQRVALIPANPLVEQFTWDWQYECSHGIPGIYEKSRRVVVSNTARGLECWRMGRQRGSWLIVDQTHENAQGQLWRIHFGLEQLMARRPELGIRRHKPIGSLDERMCSSLVMANGSLFTESYQNAGAQQGKGKTGVTLEELAKYRNPQAYWGQALIVARGGAGSAGGWVCGIANPSLNEKWRELKGGVKPREMLGFE